MAESSNTTNPSDLLGRVARALYECGPEWDGGEFVDYHQVTPAGPVPWSFIVEMGHDETYLVAARAALKETADAIEERWGNQHPGCLAIRAALDSDHG